MDPRQVVAFCDQRHLGLFEVRRSDIESFGRELEARGRATATIARRLCTVTGFYRYAEEEGLIAHSPAVHVRRPRIDYESNAIGLDRNEVGALLVAAGLGPAAEHALISVLALNGLRVSEAIGADIEALDAGVPLYDEQQAASHTDPRTTMRYDRARVSLDRYATSVVSHVSRSRPFQMIWLMMPGAAAFPPLCPGSTAMTFPSSGLPARAPGSPVTVVGGDAGTITAERRTVTVDLLVGAGWSQQASPWSGSSSAQLASW